MIGEKNKLIAEFDGWKLVIKPIMVMEGSYPKYPTEYKDVEYLEKDGCGSYRADWAKYDTSWDWLMPVVEKIENLGYDLNISEKDAFIMANDNDSDFIPIEVNGPTKLEATYKLCYQFIEWYNTNKS